MRQKGSSGPAGPEGESRVFIQSFGPRQSSLPHRLRAEPPPRGGQGECHSGSCGLSSGEPIPAADLQIRDQSHKMAELRRMKNRLRDELEQLLADNAFAVRLAETAAEEPAAPDDKPQLPE